MLAGYEFYPGGYYTSDAVCVPDDSGSLFFLSNFTFLSVLYNNFNNNGFLGLAPPTNSSSNNMNFVNELYQANSISSPTFAFQLNTNSS